MTIRPGLLLGALTAGLVARPVLNRALLVKFRRDVRRLNAGDYAPLLAGYADDAVLIFNEGPHRWSGAPGGAHRGKPAIEAFLREFVAARVQGELLGIWSSGPPWALTFVARFDDHAEAPDGTRLYENQTVLVLQTRGTKIIRHQDFYVDTQRILDFDQALVDRGIGPRGAT